MATDDADTTVGQELAETALSPIQGELLDLAFSAASKVPIKPHMKLRSSEQQSVVDAAFDAPGARDALSKRGHAFGRPLYGPDGWGVLQDGTKWSHRDRQVAFNLAKDPAETSPTTTNADDMAKAMSKALGREVVRAWRVRLGRNVPRGSTLVATHPDGFTHAVCRYDPRGYHDKVTFTVEGQTAKITAPDRRALPDAMYLLPNTADAANLTLTLQAGPTWTAIESSPRGVGPVAYTRSGRTVSRRRTRYDQTWTTPEHGEATVDGRTVLDIGSFERMCGVHLSLGSKHATYNKPEIRKKAARYHVDVFAATSAVLIDGESLFSDGGWTV